MEKAIKTESHYETATGEPGSRRNMKAPEGIERAQAGTDAVSSYAAYLTRQRAELMQEIDEIESKT